MAQYIKTEEGYKKLATFTNDKMDKTNPTGTGSFSMNRKAGTVIGFNSHAEGDNTTASGEDSHAEGYNTTASSYNSHAEGSNTTASGEHSHAEGFNTKASGNYSHAEGNGTTASGNSSHAEGNDTTASGFNSHAEGNNTKATSTNDSTTITFSPDKGYYTHAEGYGTVAYGRCSHAEGNGTKASGNDSHSEGYGTVAYGTGSHAEGDGTIASGTSSHAEGYKTTASGNYSHAEGYSTNMFSSVVTTNRPTTNDIINVWKNQKFSVAKGHYSHVEGWDNLALDDYSHAEGYQTIASGDKSHAEGGYTTASGAYSHAEGGYTTASGAYSHAEGNGTIAKGNYSHAQGKYNIEDTSFIYADIIGNGTSNARSNAATVDWNGNAWFAGDVYTGSTSGTNKDEGSKKLATEEYVNSSIAAGGGSGGASDAVLYTEQSLTEEQQAQARENINSGVAPYYVAVDRATGTWGTVSKEQLSEMRSARNTGKPVILDMKYSGNNNPRYLPLIYDGGEGNGVGDVYFGYDRLGVALAVPNGGGALYKANLFMRESMFKNGDAGQALIINSKNSDGSIEFGTKRLGAQLPELSSSVDIGLIPCVDGWDSHRFMAWKKPDEIFSGAAGGTDISLGLTSAAVGQIIKVKAIDESGKPTAWEAADMAGGGVDKNLRWAQVLEMTTTEQMNIITADKDPEGRTFASYNAIAMLTVLSIPADSTQTNASGTVWVTAQPIGYESRASLNIASWKTKSRTISQCHLGTVGGLVWCGLSNSGSMISTNRIDNIFTVVKIEVHNADDHLPIGTTVRVFLLSEENA